MAMVCVEVVEFVDAIEMVLLSINTYALIPKQNQEDVEIKSYFTN